MNPMTLKKFVKGNLFLVAIFCVLISNIVKAVEFSDESERHAGIGAGFGIVKFDSKFKFTNKETGNSVFVDPEGTLDLPEISNVNTFYAAYSFNKRHSIGFAHFRIDRESTFIDASLNFEDLILISGKASLSDKTRFYFLNYGYTWFADDRSRVSGVIGLYGLDLKYTFQVDGEIAIGGDTRTGTYKEDVSIFAPLPLFGLNFSWAFTPKWAVSTKVQLVGGSYEETSAGILSAAINARYKFSKHWGMLLGLTFFSAEVDIEDDKELQEIGYDYDGAFIGVHASI